MTRVILYEVTNEQYAAGLNWAWAQGGLITVTSGVVYQAGTGTSYPYCDTTDSSSYSRLAWDGGTFTVTAGKADHPMVEVTWYGSVAFCNWRSAMEGRPLCYDRIDEDPPNTTTLGRLKSNGEVGRGFLWIEQEHRRPSAWTHRRFWRSNRH